jgi:hypothetical protein
MPRWESNPKIRVPQQATEAKHGNANTRQKEWEEWKKLEEVDALFKRSPTPTLPSQT